MRTTSLPWRGSPRTLDKIALEIRHLQRTEVREAEEPFAAGQKGSSAMPHKRNPITCEQISGLARVVRSNAQAAFENVALWHERDISHSSVERVILPDSTILIDYLLAKTAWLISDLRVNADRMRRNLDQTKGLIFSGQLLLDLAAAGMSREEAYRLVQAYAMQSWEEEERFPLGSGKRSPSSKVFNQTTVGSGFLSRAPVKKCESHFRAHIPPIVVKNTIGISRCFVYTVSACTSEWARAWAKRQLNVARRTLPYPSTAKRPVLCQLTCENRPRKTWNLPEFFWSMAT